MGCGASQSDVIRSVVPKNVSDFPATNGGTESVMNGSKQLPSSNGNGTKMDSNMSTLSNSSTIPASDFYQDGLNRGSGVNDYLKPLPRSLPPLKPPRGAKNMLGFTDQNTNEFNLVNRNSRIEPIAFDVPVEDDSTGSLIKRHPPRRLRRTMEDQSVGPLSLTQEVLVEKVQLANQRRNQVLHERVASARQKSARVNRVRTRPAAPMLDPDHFVNDFGESSERD